MMKRLSVFDLFLLAILVSGMLRPFSFLGDPGLGWHLRNGELIMLSAEVPSIDPFLHPSAGAWVNTQWLADVLFARILAAGGEGLLYVTTLFGALVILSLLYDAVRRAKGVGPGGALVASILISLCIFAQWITRPVLLSFFLFFSVWALVRPLTFPDARRPGMMLTALLPALFALWANLHPGFALGWVLLGIAWSTVLFARYFEDRKGALLGWLTLQIPLCVLATLLNPSGITLHQTIFGLLTDEKFQNLNIEWLSPDIRIGFFAPFYLILLTCIVAGAWGKTSSNLNRQSMSWFDWGVLLFFAFIALVSRRYIPFFGIVAALPLALVFTPPL
ncbi:MAG: hypothetical protein IT290_04585, partial [Deltaproteobacteria bacterium]|nr:hypothetical protein [Deltaproteobacteria bacterium]